MHIESDLRGYLDWCEQRDLDPLAAAGPHIELYLRWLQEVRRAAPLARPVGVVVRLDHANPGRPRDRGIHRLEELLPARDPSPVAVLHVSETRLIAVHAPSSSVPTRRARHHPAATKDQRFPSAFVIAPHQSGPALSRTSDQNPALRTKPEARILDQPNRLVVDNRLDAYLSRWWKMEPSVTCSSSSSSM